MHEEVWKPVVGYEGIYEVSNFGRVKSLARYCNGKYKRFIREKILVLLPSPDGYRVVRLWKDSQEKPKMVHRLVLEAFVGPCPPGYECCHAPDNDRTNNRIDNLRWGTRQENVDDIAKYVGRRPAKGSKNGRAVLHEKDVLEIRRELAKPKEERKTVRQLYEQYGVGDTTIREIRDRVIWRHI